MSVLLFSVRDLFHRARQSIPAVIFLDEVDALVGKRDLGGHSSDAVRDRLLAALLDEMDGVEAADSVLVIVSCLRRQTQQPTKLF